MEHIYTYSYKKRKLRVFNRGKGKTLFLIHGFLQNVEFWYDFLFKLSKYFHVFAPELPGHGKSDFLPDNHFSFDLLSDLYISIIKKHQLNNVILCGHSFGGYLALHMNEKKPEIFSKVVLINSSLFEDDEKKKAERNLQIKLINNGKSKLLFKVLIQSMFTPLSRIQKKNEIQNLVIASGEIEPCVAMKFIALMKTRKEYSNMWVQEYENLIIINGQNDIYPKMIEIHVQHHPNVYTLKHTCHMAHIENPEALLKILEKF